jgi:hypothetical protein
MSLQRVQIVDLEPSTDESPTFYVVQIRGLDSDGNPGAWSREFVFQSLEQFPAEVDDIVGGDDIVINPNDILLYTGASWVGSPILFDGTIVFSDGTFPFGAAIAGIDPSLPEHLSTKRYVDESIGDLKTLTPNFGTVTIDFSEHTYLNHDITGVVTYETANIVAARTINIRIKNNSGSSQNLNFPAGWSFNGTPPANIANGKTALLELKSFGTTNSDCVATYQVN